ncbi:hypothetical protein D3C81_1393160 [compost metagenome]
MHDEQVLIDEAIDDGVGHAFAAKKNRPFLFLERAQPWIRARGQGDREDVLHRLFGADVHGLGTN